MVRAKGLEPPTYWFVASHSIQLSYARIASNSFTIIAQVKKKVNSFLKKISFPTPAEKSRPPGVCASGGTAV